MKAAMSAYYFLQALYNSEASEEEIAEGSDDFNDYDYDYEKIQNRNYRKLFNELEGRVHDDYRNNVTSKIGLSFDRIRYIELLEKGKILFIISNQVLIATDNIEYSVLRDSQGSHELALTLKCVGLIDSKDGSISVRQQSGYIVIHDKKYLYIYNIFKDTFEKVISGSGKDEDWDEASFDQFFNWNFTQSLREKNDK